MKLHRTFLLALAGLALVPGASAQAQVQTIDPNQAIDADLNRGAGPAPAPYPTATYPSARIDQAAPVGSEAPRPLPPLADPYAPAPLPAPVPAPTTNAIPPPAGSQGVPPGTYKEDDLIGAAEGVFGKGARGLALMIKDILKKQGEPIGYITGREAGGAVVVGVRYGSGTLHHKIEGDLPVYWTGPSIGFDLGAKADVGRDAPPLLREGGRGREHGESRERGQAMVDLMAQYTEAGFAIALSNRLQEIPQERTAALIARLDAADPAFRESAFADHGGVAARDDRDGLRLTLGSGATVHFRPSGNAPELRVYVEAPTPPAAEALLAENLAFAAVQTR